MALVGVLWNWFWFHAIARLFLRILFRLRLKRYLNLEVDARWNPVWLLAVLILRPDTEARDSDVVLFVDLSLLLLLGLQCFPLSEEVARTRCRRLCLLDLLWFGECRGCLHLRRFLPCCALSCGLFLCRALSCGTFFLRHRSVARLRAQLRMGHLLAVERGGDLFSELPKRC